MRVAVTGARGRVGRAVCARLAAGGHQVAVEYWRWLGELATALAPA